jgi:hypothetical protein
VEPGADPGGFRTVPGGVDHLVLGGLADGEEVVNRSDHAQGVRPCVGR